jgi:hypothetical protein
MKKKTRDLSVHVRNSVPQRNKKKISETKTIKPSGKQCSSFVSNCQLAVNLNLYEMPVLDGISWLDRSYLPSCKMKTQQNSILYLVITTTKSLILNKLE